MARVKKTVDVIVTKQYKVIEKFSGYINEKRFDHKKDELITLDDYEYSIYKRFVKEI